MKIINLEPDNVQVSGSDNFISWQTLATIFANTQPWNKNEKIVTIKVKENGIEFIYKRMF